MARACSANLSPTQVDFASALFCAAASLASACVTSAGILPAATGTLSARDPEPDSAAEEVEVGSCAFPFLGTAGAIGALTTSSLPQWGHSIRPRSCWSAKSPDEPNQPSKRWPSAQERSNTIIANPSWVSIACSQGLALAGGLSLYAPD